MPKTATRAPSKKSIEQNIAAEIEGAEALMKRLTEEVRKEENRLYADEEKLNKEFEERRNTLRAKKKDLEKQFRETQARLKQLKLLAAEKVWESKVPQTEDEFYDWFGDVGVRLLGLHEERHHYYFDNERLRSYFSALIPATPPGIRIWGMAGNRAYGNVDRIYIAWNESNNGIIGTLVLKNQGGSTFIGDATVGGKLLFKDILRVTSKNYNPSEQWVAAIKKAIEQ